MRTRTHTSSPTHALSSRRTAPPSGVTTADSLKVSPRGRRAALTRLSQSVLRRRTTERHSHPRLPTRAGTLAAVRRGAPSVAGWPELRRVHRLVFPKPRLLPQGPSDDEAHEGEGAELVLRPLCSPRPAGFCFSLSRPHRCPRAARKHSDRRCRLRLFVLLPSASCWAVAAAAKPFGRMLLLRFARRARRPISFSSGRPLPASRYALIAAAALALLALRSAAAAAAAAKPLGRMLLPPRFAPAARSISLFLSLFTAACEPPEPPLTPLPPSFATAAAVEARNRTTLTTSPHPIFIASSPVSSRRLLSALLLSLSLEGRRKTAASRGRVRLDELGWPWRL